MEKKKCVLMIAIAILSFLLLTGCAGKQDESASKKKEDERNATITNVPTVTPFSQKNRVTPTTKPIAINTPTPTLTPTPTSDPIVGLKTSFKDLKLGEIGKANDIYIGLQYVKSMSYLPTILGDKKVQDGNEVIIGFFEYLNDSRAPLYVDIEDITCYADGVQVNRVDTLMSGHVDGEEELILLDLDESFQLLTAFNWEVPKGWRELKFFYNADCIWTIQPEDVSTNAYVKTQMMIVKKGYAKTAEEQIIYDNGYAIQYMGVTNYFKEEFFWEGNHVIFKFRITNRGEAPLDTRLMGYKMRVYCDNFYIGTASSALDNKIDGCKNIYEIDHIDPGMSADVYVAFNCSKKAGQYVMIYDDGYITSHYCGYVVQEINN